MKISHCNTLSNWKAEGGSHGNDDRPSQSQGLWPVAPHLRSACRNAEGGGPYKSPDLSFSRQQQERNCRRLRYHGHEDGEGFRCIGRPQRSDDEGWGFGHRAEEIDSVDQGQRDLREMKLVAIDDIERRGKRGAHEQERQHEGSGIALRALAQPWPHVGLAPAGLSKLSNRHGLHTMPPM